VEIQQPQKTQELESGNGFMTPIPPDPGQTGWSGEVMDRTGPMRVPAGVEEAGRERRPRNGDLATDSRCERV